MNNIFVFICLLTVYFEKKADGLQNAGFIDKSPEFQESHVKKRPEAPIYPTPHIPDVPESIALKGPRRNRTVWDTSVLSTDSNNGYVTKPSVARKGVSNEGNYSANIAASNYVKDTANISKTSNAEIKIEPKIATPPLPTVSLPENSEEDSSENSEEDSLYSLPENVTNITSNLPHELAPVTTDSLNTSLSTQLNDSCDNATLSSDRTLPELSTKHSINFSLSSESVNESQSISSILPGPTNISLVPSTIGKPSIATMGDTSSPSTQSSKAAIVIAILIIVAVCALIGFIGYRRLHAYWSRRHYARVDFLIDGLYDN